MEFNKDKILFVLTFFDDYMEDLIYGILNDSEKDPHFSAVAAKNLIECYIRIMNHLSHKISFSNTKQYFEQKGYERHCYGLFEDKRKKELVYYRGIMFSNNTSLNTIDFKECLLYILDFFEQYLDEYVSELVFKISNEPCDCYGSHVVRAMDFIKNSIDIWKAVQVIIPYDDVQGYFKYNGYSIREYRTFEGLYNKSIAKKV